jgi:mono/diheme cytochrome c family protein
MIKAVTIILVIGVAVGAQQIKKVPIQSTSAASGREMFAAYCAVCHGTAGKGDGPVAKALKNRRWTLLAFSQQRRHVPTSPGHGLHQWRGDRGGPRHS